MSIFLGRANSAGRWGPRRPATSVECCIVQFRPSPTPIGAASGSLGRLRALSRRFGQLPAVSGFARHVPNASESV
eukprot:8294297-Alexandrium_andersonii.AAC.1